MSIEVKVPQLPESVQDATLVNWHKKAGDAVNRDENLVDIETDKVVLEVPAPVSGVLKEIRVKDGTTVGAGQVIAILEEGAATSAAPARSEAKPAPAPQAAAPAPQPAAASSGAAAGGDMPLSPSVRRLVEENKLDPSQIRGSARDGRLTKGDVLDYMAKRGAEPTPAALPAAAPMARATLGPRADRRADCCWTRKAPASDSLDPESSKPVRRGSPTLGRFDSGAAPLSQNVAGKRLPGRF